MREQKAKSWLSWLLESVFYIIPYILYYVGIILWYGFNEDSQLLTSARFILLFWLWWKFDLKVNSRIILALDLEIWFLYSLKFISAVKILGPKMSMVKSMVSMSTNGLARGIQSLFIRVVSQHVPVYVYTILQKSDHLFVLVSWVSCVEFYSISKYCLFMIGACACILLTSISHNQLLNSNFSSCVIYQALFMSHLFVYQHMVSSLGPWSIMEI